MYKNADLTTSAVAMQRYREKAADLMLSNGPSLSHFPIVITNGIESNIEQNII